MRTFTLSRCKARATWIFAKTNCNCLPQRCKPLPITYAKHSKPDEKDRLLPVARPHERVWHYRTELNLLRHALLPQRPPSMVGGTSRTLRRWQETHQRRREPRQFRQRMGATLSAIGQWQHRLQRDGVGERRK